MSFERLYVRRVDSNWQKITHSPVVWDPVRCVVSHPRNRSVRFRDQPQERRGSTTNFGRSDRILFVLRSSTITTLDRKK